MKATFQTISHEFLNFHAQNTQLNLQMILDSNFCREKAYSQKVGKTPFQWALKIRSK